MFRNFPLTRGASPFAEAAAEAAEDAGAKAGSGKCTMGYTKPGRLGLTLILSLGSALGLSDLGVRDALAQRRFAAEDTSDFLGGVRSGVNGTPIVLHQRREARRLLFIPGTRRGDRRAFTRDFGALEPHPVSIVRAAS